MSHSHAAAYPSRIAKTCDTPVMHMHSYLSAVTSYLCLGRRSTTAICTITPQTDWMIFRTDTFHRNSNWGTSN